MARRRSAPFGLSNFLWRWAIALLLVMATFNPYYSYTQWVIGAFGGGEGGVIIALQVVAGLALLIGYIIYIRATLRSIGPIGAILVVVLLLAIIWVLSELGLFQERIREGEFWIWIGLIMTATVLAVGISWSHVRRRITGQYDMDDIDA